MPYTVLVFDSEGRVIEANIIQAPNPSTAVAVSSVSPLRVSFKGDDGSIHVCSGEFSQATWRHDFQKKMDLDRTLEEIFKRWQRSGSTNFAEWDRMMMNAITNSQR